ncbi:MULTISPECIES: ABC transporter permease [Methanoculleus]|uniref:ABC-type transport system involved in multi-copper enzyme maturation permease component-like protein n=2 Tax=Methanoculleus TaxID=45989 RepID=A3CXA0_METMJ|nr:MULTISPECIES: ABC transporter permease subunit [Methanoculleus]ABN58000.1 ABC-type transport system involved in multi-copper enzyme maturation permease component-like protein [Methanoculleus marisnigri JR1]MCC7554663.1 ABC transporter permease [Methanoculleus marisnigri]UYU19382.1 ABC transporter permease [Methanoculleus submarinus]
MTIERSLTVAAKELSDLFTNRRFLLIFFLYLIIAMVGTGQGLERYDSALTSYNDALQAADEYRNLQDLGAWWLEMPERPSVLLIFDSMAGTTVTLGALLAIAAGFDQVTREKESRSLKTLLAHPVYRDEVVVGKALGGAAALGVIVGLVLAIITGLLLILSIVPTAGEVVAILIFGAISLLFLVAWFAVALAFSTVTRESGNALVFTLVIFFVVSSLLPVLGAMVGGLVAGPPPQRPEQPEVIPVEMYVSTSAGESFVQRDDSGQQASVWSEALRDYQEDLAAYTAKKRLITNVVTLLSPQKSYQDLTDFISAPGEESFLEPLGSVWAGITGLIVFPAVFFAAAYRKFVRMDIR